MTPDSDPIPIRGNREQPDLTLPASGPSPGAMVGPYRIVRELGEGGMGIVFHAQQLQPMRRDVALKLIKPGMDSRHVIARFESERQALALMDHPNIARVFDAGTTSAGLPYFVMELVAGVPITRYCDSRRLALRDRIELFIPVCRAIQHAHQKGIIHRDVKPSNVLVGEREGKPVPKVIDFGLVKALGDQMSNDTVMTTPGVVVGTLRYMSPEQAELGKHDIDTRSDVYSLGAVLYELVTGTAPLDEESTSKNSYLEILMRIRDEEPAPPSSRIRRSSKSAEIAQRRRSDPERYPNLLHGELDWIVMRALEKERSRRYETANAMARDLERYLAGEPLEAAPPSATYRARKFVRKHRAWFAAAAAFLTLLIAAVIVSSWMAIRATRAEREALVERNAAKSVSDFLQNDLLAQASAGNQAGPATRPDPDLKVRTALDRAAARIEGKFASQPLIEAAIRQTMGTTYERLGLYPEALKHAERALELRRRELGEQSVDTSKSLRLVATVRWDQGSYDEAATLVTKALETQRRILGDEHPDTLNSLNTLAAALAYQGKLSQAGEMFAKALAIQRRVLGESNSQTLYLMNNLAAIHYRQGKFAEAEALHAKALEIRRRLQGEEHPGTLNSMSNLGEVYLARGRYSEAESLHRRVLETRRRVLGEEHPETLTSLRNVAAAHQAEGKFDAALPLFVKALDGRRRVLGEEHPKTLSSVKDLAIIHHEASGKLSQAEPLLLRTLEIQRRVLGRTHPEAMDTLVWLGAVLLRRNSYHDAESALREALLHYEKTAPDSSQRYKSQSILGAILVGQARYSEAEPLLLSGYEGLTGLQSTIPAPERFSSHQLIEPFVMLYQKWEKPAKAAEWRQKLRESISK